MTSPPSSQPMSACSWVTPGQRQRVPGHRAGPGQRAGPGRPPCRPLSISATAAITASEISRTSRRTSGRAGGGALLAPDVQRHRRRDQRCRGQVVHRDPARVELGQHDDAADDRLGHDGARLGRGQPDQVAAPPASGPDLYRQAATKTSTRGHEDRGGHQAVAELDPAVDQRVAVIAAGHQAVRRALRPVRAAQPGLAEPDRGAGQDDERRRQHPGQRVPPHRPRGRAPAPSPPASGPSRASRGGPWPRRRPPGPGEASRGLRARAPS